MNCEVKGPVITGALDALVHTTVLGILEMPTHCIFSTWHLQIVWKQMTCTDDCVQVVCLRAATRRLQITHRRKRVDSTV